MTGNRLTLAADNSGGRAFQSVDAMRDWCWQRNQQARDAGWAHWLYVSEDKETGAHSIKSRNGSDALDVIKLIRGWYPDFMNWEPERLASEFRILRHIARMGMPEAFYQPIRFASPPRQLEPA